MVGDTKSTRGVDVARGRLNEATTIVSWEPEPPGVGLTVTYELIRRHTARATLVGELDYFAVDQTRDALLSALPWAVNWIELDAGSLRFCDVAGLELFVDFDRRCAQEAGGLRIVNAPRQLTRLLELSDQTTLLTRTGSVIGHEPHQFKQQLDRALSSRRHRPGHEQ